METYTYSGRSFAWLEANANIWMRIAELFDAEQNLQYKESTIILLGEEIPQNDREAK
jgi:hypothetical protein